MAGDGETRRAGGTARAANRTPDEIQRDIERSREALATSLDQLVTRTSPRRLIDDTRQTLIERAQTPAGMAAISAAGGLVVVLVVARIRKAGRNKADRNKAGRNKKRK